ncbi:MAG: T9SS type A sorting domain-containing protein [Chitinophagales bacterium]|nr:T9SS type A sorting domain-containing protein [Chitinophagales bacterium]
MRYFLLLGIIGSSLLSVASGNGGCGTTMPEDFKQHYYSKDMSYLNEQGARAGIRWVPIVYHIITKDDGTGGISLKPIFDSHCELNQAYNQFDIGFFIEAIDSLRSSTLYSNKNPSGWSTFSQENVPNVCNVYISPDLNVCGFATYPGLSSGGGVFLNKGCYGKGSTTLQHEMGHWLGLPHTFEQTNPVEYVNGSNCSTKGDRFCDTPADFVDYRASCPYNGLQADPNGDLYKDVIDETLYMSYFLDNCQNRFSPMQQAEMNNTLTFDRPTVLNHATPDLSPLPTTTFITPLDGDTTLMANSTLFKWRSIPGAKYYHFTLQSGTSTVVFVDSIISDTSIIVGSLSPNKSYKFRVKGLSFGNACSSFTPDQTIKTSNIKALITVLSPSCPGQSDAQISVAPNNGTPPYAINWSNGDTLNTVTNLASGAYSVTITDATGAVAIATIAVGEPQPLATSINKVGSNLTAFASGGTPPYSYMWSNGPVGPGNNGVGFGTYTVTITDSRGCEATETFVFSSLSNLTETVTSVKVYPNPASKNSDLRVELTANKAADAFVTILNVNGQVMQQKPLLMQVGNNFMTFNTATFPSGIYYLQVKTDVYSQVIRVLVAE